MTTPSAPPPRRKSCNACVKAKRRCDLLTPQCSRCFQKNVDCVYDGQLPKRKHHNQKANASANATSVAAARRSVPPAASLPTSADPSAQPEPVLDLPEFNFDAATWMMPDDFSPSKTFMEFVPTFPLPPFPDGYPSPDTSATPSSKSAKIYSHEDYDHLEDICVRA